MVEGVEPLQRAVDVDGLVPPALAQQPDHPLRLAEGIGPDDVAAFGELPDGLQQSGDLLGVGREAEHRQAEGGLGDEHLAGHRLEGRAGRVAPSLVVSRDHHGQAGVAHHRLGRAQDVAGGRQADLDIVAAERLAVAHRLGSAAEVLAVAGGHDLQRLGGGDHHAVAGPGMVGVAVGDHRPIHRPHRVDEEIAGGAVEPLGLWAEQGFRPHDPCLAGLGRR